jgi:hypothetical protein
MMCSCLRRIKKASYLAARDYFLFTNFTFDDP